MVFETLQKQIFISVGRSRHSLQDSFLPNLASSDFLVHGDRCVAVETQETISIVGCDRGVVFVRVVQLQIGRKWPAPTNTQGGQSHNLE